MSEPVTNIMDLRALARRRVPRAFFEYADRGSYDESTLHENRAALARIRLRQRVMIDVDNRSLATEIVGEPVSMPLAIAPTGLTGLQHGSGEIHGARAAARAGIPFCLSTMSICSIEQVRAATDTPFWFQVYVMRDRGFTRELIGRAREAGCSALMLTADLTVQGQRHREIKNGLAVPPKVTLRNLFDIASKPRWAWNVLRAPSRSFGNLEGRIGGADSLTTLAQWIANQFDPTLSWQDLAWIRELWPGKLIVKGIMDVEDAKMAVAAGADAILVSNHGGRQLDSAPSTASVLASIVDAVGDRTEVYVDSGVRSGLDVLKFLGLGARACFIGRAYLYGLGAYGQAGVAKALEILKDELSVAMALTGVTDVAKVPRDIILRPPPSPSSSATPTSGGPFRDVRVYENSRS